MNLLFVCSKNQWRSPTAEAIYKDSQAHHAKSCGTSATAVVRASAKLILWAEIIFVMEKKHKQRLMEQFPEEAQQRQIIILDIEDDYQYMDEELKEIIKTTVEPYLAIDN